MGRNTKGLTALQAAAVGGNVLEASSHQNIRKRPLVYKLFRPLKKQSLTGEPWKQAWMRRYSRFGDFEELEGPPWAAPHTPMERVEVCRKPTFIFLMAGLIRDRKSLQFLLVLLMLIFWTLRWPSRKGTLEFVRSLNSSILSVQERGLRAGDSGAGLQE